MFYTDCNNNIVQASVSALQILQLSQEREYARYCDTEMRSTES